MWLVAEQSRSAHLGCFTQAERETLTTLLRRLVDAGGRGAPEAVPGLPARPTSGTRARRVLESREMAGQVSAGFHSRQKLIFVRSV